MHYPHNKHLRGSHWLHNSILSLCNSSEFRKDFCCNSQVQGLFTVLCIDWCTCAHLLSLPPHPPMLPLVKPFCEKPELEQKSKFISTFPSRELFFRQVILEKIKQRSAYSMVRLISVRSKQEVARELSEDMLGASLAGGHANGEARHFMGLGDLMGPGEWGPGTVRKMEVELFFSPMGSQKPLALSLPFGSGPVAWGVGSVVAVVALVAVVVLLEASLVPEAGSGGQGKSAGPSPWGGSLGPWLVATFLTNRGPFFRASGPVYGLPISRSSTRRNCKQMTGLCMGWAHHFHFPLTLTSGKWFLLFFFWEEQFSQNSQFLPDCPIQFSLQTMFSLASLGLAPSDQYFSIFPLPPASLTGFHEDSVLVPPCYTHTGCTRVALSACNSQTYTFSLPSP